MVTGYRVLAVVIFECGILKIPPVVWVCMKFMTVDSIVTSMNTRWVRRGTSVLATGTVDGHVQ